MPYIHRLHPELLRFSDHLAIRWYGLSYLAGFVLGYLLLKRFIRKGQLHMSAEQLQDCLTSFCIFGVLLGGRAGYFLFYEPGTLLQNPLQFFKVWEGGMASHGGILGGMAVLAWYARKTHIPFLHLTDAFAVVAPLGIGFGRLANFINGELWGRPTEVPWAVVFPLERPEFHPGQPLESLRYNLAALQEYVQQGYLTPRHPSQLYQAAAEGFGLFLALLWLHQTPWARKKNGRISAIFLLGYAVARFGMEFFREPDARIYFGWLTTGQLLTLFMALGGLLLLFWERPVSKKEKKKA
jgi:phosphatidylglycerol:prolipoprotein diacylglycerol transferase